PFIEGPIGARSGKDAQAWIFPGREASHTKYLTPNELPMYMNPKVRRVLLLLERIPDKERVQLWFHANHENVAHPQLASRPALKGSADLGKNSVLFFVPPEIPIRISKTSEIPSPFASP